MKIYESPVAIQLMLEDADILTISYEDAGFGDRVDFDLI